MTWNHYINLFESLKSKNQDDIIISLRCLDSFQKNLDFKIYTSCLWRLLIYRALFERINYSDKVQFMPIDLFKEYCPECWGFINTELKPIPVHYIIESAGTALKGNNNNIFPCPKKEYELIKEYFNDK